MRTPELKRRVAMALRAAGVQPGERLLVAVSGGVDSMVLLHALVALRPRLGLRLHALHVHHGIRGKAADRDAAFVVASAARWGVGVSLCQLDPSERPRGASLQVWARTARYQCLESLAQRLPASRLLTAHSQDDQAETVLLNLLRGTGPRGLGGIPARRARILRPLLEVSRAEVEAYAAAHHVDFRLDASNASLAYRRNRVRHRLIPLLAKEFNPRIVQSVARLATLLREDDQVLHAQADALFARAGRVSASAVCLERSGLRGSPPALLRRVFQAAFQQVSGAGRGLTWGHLPALARLLTGGGVVELPGGVRALRVGTEIHVRSSPRTRPASESGCLGSLTAPRALGPKVGRFPPPSLIRVRPGVWTGWPALGCRVRVSRLPARGVPTLPRDGCRVALSPLLLQAPLALRSWRAGDRFRPLGMSGRKKLQDFFVDAKVPREARNRVPLLLSGDRIAWVIGYRIAEDFRWRGRGPACLVEVRFPGGEHALAPSRRHPDHDG